MYKDCFTHTQKKKKEMDDYQKSPFPELNQLKTPGTVHEEAFVKLVPLLESTKGSLKLESPTERS
jgi:hypothetical protein